MEINKHIPYQYLFYFFILLTCIGCKKEEEVLLKEKINFVKFEFPQGNTNEDKQIEKISNKYGTFIIYKNLQPKDYEKSWLLSASEMTYNITDLSVENLPAYIDIIERKVLESFDQGFINKALPIYIYLTDSLYTLERRSWLAPGQTQKEYYFVRTDFEIKMTGMDYWAFSFPKDKLSNATFLRSFQLRVSYEIIKKLWTAGAITEPESFLKMVDYETDVEQTDKTDPNHYLKRGFSEWVSEEFDAINRFSLWFAKHDNGDFLAFIRFMMFFTKEEFNEKYPLAEFPLLHQRYNFLYNHLLSQKVDLQKIAEINKTTK